MAFSTRPSRPASPRTRPSARPPAADVGTVVSHAVGTALLAAVIGLAIALILGVSSWALAPHAASTGADASVRLAVMAWLLAHHVTIELPAGALSLTPLGLTLVPAALCYAGGRQLSRSLHPEDLGAVGRIAGLFALAYGVVVAVAAGLSAGDGLRPHAVGAWAAGSLLAVAAGGLGLLRASGLLPELVGRVPFGLRQVLSGAAAALVGLVGAGALVLALLLTVSFPEALQITRAIDADLLGGILVAALSLSLLPNLVVWVLAFTTGVGFTLGVDAPVTPQAVEYGPLPVLPPMAAVPPEGPLPGWALLVLLVPVAAGAVAGVVVHRRAPGQPPEAVAGSAALAGLLAGGLLGLLAWLSAGSAGAQQLSSVGPTGWQVGLVAAFEMSLVAAVVAWESHRRQWDGQVRMPAAVRERLARRRD